MRRVVSWIRVTSLAILLVSIAAVGQAQTSFSQKTREKLKTAVRLSLGAVPVKQALAVLSKQTGLSLAAESGLQERQVILEMPNLRASDALNALAACYDWVWQETNEGKLLLKRRSPRRPENLTQVPPALVSALPKEVRDFLYIDASASQLERLSLPRQGAGEGQSSGKTASSLDASEIKLNWLVSQRVAAFIKALEPEPSEGYLYTYRRLAPETQKQFLACLLLMTLRDTNPMLLYNVFAPYQLNMDQAVIELKDNTLSVGSYASQNGQDFLPGFGASLEAAGFAASP